MTRGHWSAAAAGVSMLLVSSLSIAGLVAPWWSGESDLGLGALGICGEDAAGDGTCSYFQAARAFNTLMLLFSLTSAAILLFAYATARRLMHAGMGLWAMCLICSLLTLGMGSAIDSKLLSASTGAVIGDRSQSGAGWVCLLLATAVCIGVGVLFSFTELAWPKPPKPSAEPRQPKASPTATTEQRARETC